MDFVSLETSNDGVTDQSRPNHLLAKEGDNLTLYFRTTERIAGVDETVTNSLLEPIVEFKAGKDNHSRQRFPEIVFLSIRKPMNPSTKASIGRPS